MTELHDADLCIVIENHKQDAVSAAPCSIEQLAYFIVWVRSILPRERATAWKFRQ